MARFNHFYINACGADMVLACEAGLWHSGLIFMRELLKLSLPVVLGFLGIMFMSVVDILAVGRVSAVATGAVGVGTSVFNWAFLFAIGLLSAMEYLSSHAQGAGDRERGRRILAQAVRVSYGLGLFLTVLLLAASRRLEWFGLNEQVLVPSQRYLEILSWSILPGLLFTAFRSHLQAMAITRSAVEAIVLGNIINAVLNYMLVFGNWGAPRLEEVGSAWATVIARVFMAIWVGWDIIRREGSIPWAHDREEMARLWKVGLPSALQMTFEVGVFAFSTTLAGRLEPSLLAAHQVVLNIASVAFIVPFGIGSATAVLVGRALGEGKPALAVSHGRQGIALGVGFMVTSAVLFTVVPGVLISVYTDQADVIAAGLSVISIAALFQLSDGAQAVTTGALRGASDTRSSAISNLLGHWGIGLPLGVYLCFYAGKSLPGLWMGLATGLTAVAAALLWSWRRREKILLATVGGDRGSSVFSSVVASEGSAQ